MKTMKNSKVAAITLAALLLSGCSAKPETKVDVKPNERVASAENEVKEDEGKPPENLVKKEYFVPLELSSAVQATMSGNSYPSYANPDIISYDDLRAVNIKYYGFDDKVHEDGVLIVNKDIAEEVGDIFEELLEKKYPIQRITMIDDYNADDDKSMKANNTSAFCYREIAGTDVLSNHSFGRAIDVNPLQNPQVTSKGKISPEEGRPYVDRSVNRKGMIQKGDDCYNAFVSRGWTWGGDWNSTKDYQHFEKVVNK